MARKRRREKDGGQKAARKGRRAKGGGQRAISAGSAPLREKKRFGRQKSLTKNTKNGKLYHAGFASGPLARARSRGRPPIRPAAAGTQTNLQRCLSGLRSTTGNRVYLVRVPRVQIPLSAPRATAFEPDGKGIAISFHKWSCGRCRGKTIQAEKLRAQLQCSRSGRQVCQKAVMRKRAAGKPVALFRCPTHPVPPDRLKRRCFFVIVYRY